ncbi:MAG: ABC transporter ATP-binding protein [Eubacteriales bacterium]|nr:ABC transporter ATP-binding protein [Eubacteriales bacterium]MDY4008589.1 ABC transporter ATP-binding protein [Candidatus Limiplasma sp.]
MRPVLEVSHATMQFGGLIAVNDLNMVIGDREIVALIGPNGAGKTTAFNMITGVYKPTSGLISLNSQNITGLKPNRIAQKGIARTFQNIRLFTPLTVSKNVDLAQHVRLKSNWVAATLRTPRYRKEMERIHARTDELLAYMGLADVKDELAGSLPYGKQRKLEIARALATQPSLLLLDEPAAGMNPAEAEELQRLICGIRDQFHIAILLIEHHMDVVMGISDRIYVLNYGTLIASGSAREIQNNDAVISAYLGVNDDDA